MQTTSETYKTLLAKGTNVTSKEVRATIGLDEYYQDQLVEVKTTSALMTGDNLIGNCIASTLDIKIRNPNTIQRMAQIDIEVRLDDGETQSEWLPKGTYFIDTRAIEDDVLHIVAYDAMLKTEQNYVQSGSQVAEEYTVWRLASASVDDGSVTGATFTPLYANKETATNAPVAGDYLSLADGVAKVSTVESDTVTWIADTSFDYPSNWPQPDVLIVGAIAKRIGVPIDARTLALMSRGYLVQYPGIVLEDGTPKYSADGGLTMREVLGYIGVMYGGNWCISDAGELRLVPFAIFPFINPINTDNPALGETVYFTAYPDIMWQVQHIDGDYVYLALTGNVESTEFGSNTTYSGSTIAQKCTDYLNNTIPNVAQYLKEVTVNGVTAKVFIPSKAMYESDWDYPKQGASQRATAIDNWSSVNYAIWTSTYDDFIDVWIIYDTGRFDFSAPSYSCGFRPAVKVKFKEGT